MTHLETASVFKLPAFIPPMQAKPGSPFDSDQYAFEIKWDGTRAVCFIDYGGYRLAADILRCQRARHRSR